jgi:hypothetical protein
MAAVKIFAIALLVAVIEFVQRLGGPEVALELVRLLPDGAEGEPLVENDGPCPEGSEKQKPHHALHYRLGMEEHADERHVVRQGVADSGHVGGGDGFDGGIYHGGLKRVGKKQGNRGNEKTGKILRVPCILHFFISLIPQFL